MPDDAIPIVHLNALARDGNPGTVWAYGGADLNANLLVLREGEEIAAHVNEAVDVLLIGFVGAGTVTVDEGTYCMAAGDALVIPKGTRRSICADATRFAYLTCHRRRAGLWPESLPE